MMDRTVYKIKKLRDRDSDLEYWLSRPPEERLRTIEILRQRYLEMFYHGNEQGLQRVYRIAKRSRR